MCICFSFQQNSKVGMTVRTCICNVFECDIHCKIYTYLLHLCYIRCKLTFSCMFASFSFSKFCFSMDCTSSKLVLTFSMLFKLIFVSKLINKRIVLLIKYQVLWCSNFHQKDARKIDVLSRLPLHCNTWTSMEIIN